MDAIPPLLDVVDLAKHYALGQQTVEVLSGLNLSMRAGEVVAIMGPSGAGKTTLLNCLAGLESVDAGEVRLAGETVNPSDETRRTRLRREQVGIVFQFFNLVPGLTVAENVALPNWIGGRKVGRCDDDCQALIAKVGMAHRADHFPHQLSGGEMQLVSIARALAARPQLLLADEPTGNVNPQSGKRIMQLLVDLGREQGTGVLLVTHSPEHAAWADRVCFLRDGRIESELDARAAGLGGIHAHLLELGI